MSDAIEDITHSPYSHVALCISDTEVIEAIFPDGVHETSITKYEGKADIYTPLAVPYDITSAITKSISFLGERYDDLLIIYEFFKDEIDLRFSYHEKRHKDLICSTCIRDSFLPNINLTPGIKYPTPGDLSKSTVLQLKGEYIHGGINK